MVENLGGFEIFFMFLGVSTVLFSVPFVMEFFVDAGGVENIVFLWIFAGFVFLAGAILAVVAGFR